MSIVDILEFVVIPETGASWWLLPWDVSPTQSLTLSLLPVDTDWQYRKVHSILLFLLNTTLSHHEMNHTYTGFQLNGQFLDLAKLWVVKALAQLVFLLPVYLFLLFDFLFQ